jgi:hypothetical protein
MRVSPSVFVIALGLTGVPVAVGTLAPGGARAQDLGYEGGSFDGSGMSDVPEDAPNRGYRLGAGARADMPARYVVQRGDTLWDVTGRYYGDPFLWPRVWSYNPEITNPHWIYPEGQLQLVPPGGPPAVTPAGPHVALTREPRVRIGHLSEGSVLLREEGFLDRDALRESGEIVGSPEDHMLLMTYDQVYVQFDAAQDARVAPGQEWTVYTEAVEGDAPAADAGTLVRIYGIVRINSYDRERHMARATITEALEPIERGHRIAAMPRRFDVVEPRRNERDLRAHVVAALRPRTLLGEQQVVFLDVGSQQGVQVGNRLFVVRRGDTWQEEIDGSAFEPGSTVQQVHPPGEYPEEVLAEVRVVGVRPSTCTALVTASTSELGIGDQAEMRRGY